MLNKQIKKDIEGIERKIWPDGKKWRDSFVEKLFSRVNDQDKVIATQQVMINDLINVSKKISESIDLTLEHLGLALQVTPKAFIEIVEIKKESE